MNDRNFIYRNHKVKMIKKFYQLFPYWELTVEIEKRQYSHAAFFKRNAMVEMKRLIDLILFIHI